LQSLAKAGVSPLDVTDVLVTHSHLDHVGGLVDARGRPVFPNATIRMSAREWAAMQVSGETRALAAAIAGQVQTFEPPQEVLPCITARPLYGHTDGHVGYDLLSEGQRLEDIGDTAHAVVLQAPHPDWKDGYDADPTRGTPSRVAEFRRLAEAHELVFSPHFPFPGVGRLEVAGEGYVWRPGP
jgi:glyoxylase-like metal-dependent hydrolase (beta-lactamase superfamily II)